MHQPPVVHGCRRALLAIGASAFAFAALAPDTVDAQSRMNDRWVVDGSYGNGGIVSLPLPRFTGIHARDAFVNSTVALTSLNGFNAGTPFASFGPTGVPLGVAPISAPLGDALDGSSRLLGVDPLGRVLFAGGGGVDRATSTFTLDTSWRQNPEYVGRRGLTAASQEHLLTPLLASAEGNQLNLRPQIQRFLPDGRLDMSFGTNGTVATAATVTCLVQQADRSFVALSGNRFQAYTRDGVPDTAWGQNGILALPARTPLFGDRVRPLCQPLADGGLIIAQQGRLLTRVAPGGRGVIGPVRFKPGPNLAGRVRELRTYPDSSVVIDTTGDLGITSAGGVVKDRNSGAGWTTHLEAFTASLRPQPRFNGQPTAVVTGSLRNVVGDSTLLPNGQLLAVANTKGRLDLVRLSLSASSRTPTPGGLRRPALAIKRPTRDSFSGVLIAEGLYRCPARCAAARLTYRIEQARRGQWRTVLQAPAALMTTSRPFHINLGTRRAGRYRIVGRASDGYGRSAAKTVTFTVRRTRAARR